MRNLRKPEIRSPCLVAQHPLRTRTCNVTKNIIKTMKQKTLKRHPHQIIVESQFECSLLDMNNTFDNILKK